MGFGQYSGHTFGNTLARGQPRQPQKKFVFGDHASTCHVWAQQNPETREGRSSDGRIKFDGPTLYSYGSHFPLAHFTGKELNGRAIVLVNSDSYSVSTSKHKHHTWRALDGLPVLDVHVSDLKTLLDPSARWDKKARRASLKAAHESAVENLARALSQKPNEWNTAEEVAKMQREARDNIAALKVALGIKAKTPRNPVAWVKARDARAEAKRNADKRSGARALVLKPLNVAELVRLAGEELKTYQIDDALRLVNNTLKKLRSARHWLSRTKAPAHLTRRASAHIKTLEPYKKLFEERRAIAAQREAHEKDLSTLADLRKWIAEQSEHKRMAREVAGYVAPPPRQPSALWNFETSARLAALAYRENMPDLGDYLRDHVNLTRWRMECPEPMPKRAEERGLTPDDWRAGKGPASWFGYNATLLRRQGEELVTSKGARVPWDHALKAFDLVQSLRAKGRTYERNGHTVRVGHYAIDRIDAAGNLVAGCHSLQFEEMLGLAIREAQHAVKPAFPLPVVLS